MFWVKDDNVLISYLPHSDDGESGGVGTDCIKSPDDGVCGCENSDGTFVPGGSACV